MIHCKKFRRISQVLLVAASLLPGFLQAWAHVGNHPSVHDTTAGVLQRFKRTIPHDQLKKLTVDQAFGQLTESERAVFASEHISFSVNVPVVVSILRDVKWAAQPFWLKERGFVQQPGTFKANDITFDIWQKTFPAGNVGLGVNSLSGGGTHYLVTLAPSDPTAVLAVTNLYPGQLRLAVLKKGTKPYVDLDVALDAVPPALEGQVLLQTIRESRDAGKILNAFQFTPHPSSRQPDQVVLTWSEDPKTTQTIQWRTAPGVKKGFVQYQKKAAFERFRSGRPQEVKAVTTRILTPTLLNDPLISRHTATLRGLEPGTTYVYSVGDGSSEGWTQLSEFTTAPGQVRPFTFIYMGDAQNGLDRWGSLVKGAYRERPDAAFYIMAGDLVNRGAERDDWDALFHNSTGVYDRRQLVPVLGNHECQGGHPSLYLKLFGLMTNGPASVEAERAYSFEYSNAQFVILDSNLKPETQTAWLDSELGRSKAKWKFVVYHHPAYSSTPKRDNKDLRQSWGPVFDKHHVDLALQGHDHAYLRTYPMKGEKRVKTPKEGTVYIVSVSGVKHYEQDKRDYTEFGMTNVSTYQVLDVQIDGDRLVYRAYDSEGQLRDQLIINKP